MQEESVWDYPRPAVCEAFDGEVKVILQGQVLASSTKAWRVLETSHPPTYYIPPEDIDLTRLSRNRKKTLCEWKGQARYFDAAGLADVGWCYDQPTATFQPITGFISFYASKMEACFVNGTQVLAQDGDFYGGWITPNIKGPFKGGPGTWGW